MVFQSVQKCAAFAVLAAVPLLTQVDACGLEHLAGTDLRLRNLASGDYDYDTKGPSKWAELFEGCATKEQSPIDLPASTSFSDIVSDPLKKNVLSAGISTSYFPETNNTNSAEPLSISHGKYTVVVPYSGHASSAISPQLSELVGRAEGALVENGTASWVLEQFHFHWGEDDTVGSEHTVAGKSEALEVHLVHRNAKYASLGDAVGNADGLMVIGRLFKADGENTNAQIQVLLDSIDASSSFQPGESTPLTAPFSVSEMTFGPGFNGETVVDFYTYAGSLTTPGCNEAVTWVVLENTGTVSVAQMEAFRAIKGGDDLKAILRNWRDVQELNDRTLYYTPSLRSLSGSGFESRTDNGNKVSVAVVLLGTLGGFVVLGGIVYLRQRMDGSATPAPTKTVDGNPSETQEVSKV